MYYVQYKHVRHSKQLLKAENKNNDISRKIN